MESPGEDKRSRGIFCVVGRGKGKGLIKADMTNSGTSPAAGEEEGTAANEHG
jgi:hypothetical protein